jgi:hypothetical protein
MELGMSALSAFILLAVVSGDPSVERVKPPTAPVTKPALVEVPKGPNGLTLYNAGGDAVAKCDKKDDAFGNCKLEPGYTLDDLMNAWVHAYEELTK